MFSSFCGCKTRFGLNLAFILTIMVWIWSGVSLGQDLQKTKKPWDLNQVWPDHPEWAAMFVDILEGSQLGPTDGWFKKAVTQTRYGWDATRAKLDQDGDGEISRKEFAGSDRDFARLDRERDGVLTASDFDFTAHALMPSPGSMLFMRTDLDGNGKITQEEWLELFQVMDMNQGGFLALEDLQRFVNPPTSRPRMVVPPSSASQGPTKWTLVKGLFTQEIGSLQPGPKLGEKAPDFRLKTVDGQQEVVLSQLVGDRPIVLIFGNFTCGPFRNQAGNVEKLYQRYKDRAHFLMVYVREAHPTDGWSMESNNRVGVKLAQPKTYAERVKVAQTCSRTLKLGMPLLVDAIHDPVGARYSGMPSRLYLIDQQGTIAFKNGRGPFGFKPAELEQALILELLANPPAKSKSESKPKP